MRKAMITVLAAAAMSMVVSMSAFASGRQGTPETGLWFGANEDNTQWYANGWKRGEIDQETGGFTFYYLNEQGYALINTTTPDGQQVNEKGQWVQNGVIPYFFDIGYPAEFSKIAIIVDRAVEITADGWQQEADGRWKYAYNGTYLAQGWYWITNGSGKMECYSFTPDAYLETNTQKTNGRFMNADGKWEKNGVVQTIAQPIPVAVLAEGPLKDKLAEQGKTFDDEVAASSGSSGSSIFEREGYNEDAVDEYVDSYRDLVDSIKNLERDVKSGQQMLEDHKRRMYSSN